MNDAALAHKRKIVEIPLPSFSWKVFLSLRSLLFFTVLSCGMLTAYWLLAVRPYLWVHSGRVDAVSLQIRSNETGTLSQLAVQDGDRVGKGKVLFSLENDQMFEGQKKIHSSLVELREQQNIYKRQSEKAMQDYLSDLGMQPQEEIDQHLQILQDAQTKIVELQLEIDAAEAQSKSLKLQLDKCTVVAPFEGVVLKQKKTIGDLIQTGEPVLSLFDLNRSWIEVRVPEKKLHLIELGQSAKIRLPAYPGREWEGTVSWIGPATLSKIEGTAVHSDEEEIPVKISFPKENFPIKPGLSAQVGIKVH